MSNPGNIVVMGNLKGKRQEDLDMRRNKLENIVVKGKLKERKEKS